MKLPLLFLTALCIAASPVAVLRAADKPAEAPAKIDAKVAKAKWFTSIKAARKAAKEAKLPVLMLFTGSDWCPWCIKLEKEILSQKDFKDWAGKHVVLYLADFPNSKQKIDEAANRKMMKEYGASGFPTVILTDAAGKKLGQSGYKKLKPAAYAKDLESIIGAK